MGPGPAVREDTPWERRATVGWFHGLFDTWKQTIFTPQAFWASVKPDGSWTDALLYAWLLFAVGLLVSAPFSGLSKANLQQVLDQMGQLPPEARAAIRNWASGASGLQLGFSLFLYPLGLIIFAAIQHLFCLLLGAGKNGFYATFRVVAYAAAPNIVGLIPCLGILAGLYGGFLLIIGLAAVQETTVGRATGAVVLPGLLLCCCVGVGAALFGAAIYAALGHAGQ